MEQETQQQPQDKLQEESRQKTLRRRLWEWLGFGERGEKTGLDLIQVVAALSIPITVVVVGSLFTAAQTRNQREAEEQRAQDAALQAYLDAMGQLLLDEKLLPENPDEEAQALARARTLTILERLTTTREEGASFGVSLSGGAPAPGRAPAKLLSSRDRKSSVLLFLYESNLINKKNPVINLDNANLIELSLVNSGLQRFALLLTHPYHQSCFLPRRPPTQAPVPTV